MSILLACVFVVNSGAEESEDVVEHVSCVTEHFDWVQNERIEKEEHGEVKTYGIYPENDVGSCFYVAMSLLLSFYDAYWDDRFVPDEYETMGTVDMANGAFLTDFHLQLENFAWKDIYENNGLEQGTTEFKNAYSEFIDNNADKFLQMYLISVALERGYYDWGFDYSMLAIQMVNFLEYYLYDLCGFTSDQIVVHREFVLLPSNKDELAETAVNVIGQGFPIIFCAADLFPSDSNSRWIEDNVFAAHVLLGYDITEDGNDVVLSKCWNKEETTTLMSTVFDCVNSIIWLEINPEALPHQCSPSYKDRRSSSTTFCACQIYRDHPLHQCVSRTGGTQCTGEYSDSFCLCGQEVVVEHNYRWLKPSVDGHYRECDCGNKQSIEQHVWEYSNIQSETHTESCFCGYSQTKYHDHKSCYSKTNVLHTVTCSCGKTYTENHNLERINVRYSVCMNCGYTRDHFGGNENVHLGTKEDEETE